HVGGMSCPFSTHNQRMQITIPQSFTFSVYFYLKQLKGWVCIRVSQYVLRGMHSLIVCLKGASLSTFKKLLKTQLFREHFQSRGVPLYLQEAFEDPTLQRALPVLNWHFYEYLTYTYSSYIPALLFVLNVHLQQLHSRTSTS